MSINASIGANGTAANDSLIFNNRSLSKSEIYGFLESEYNKGCSGIFASQLWYCSQETPNYAFGILACIIAVIGIVGNIVSIVALSCDKKIQKLIYRGLVFLLVADIGALVSYFVGGYIINVIVKFDFKLSILLGFSILSTHTASLHVIMIIILRYMLQIHPMRCQNPVLLKLLVVCSFFWWVISLILAIGFMVPIALTFENTEFSSISEYQELLEWFSRMHTYLRMYMLGLPVLVILIFSVLRRCGTSFVHVHKRVSNAITVMMFITVLACCEEITLHTLAIVLGDNFDYHLISSSSEFQIYPINPITWVFNHSIKPVILIFLTPLGRRFCKFISCKRSD